MQRLPTGHGDIDQGALNNSEMVTKSNADESYWRSEASVAAAGERRAEERSETYSANVLMVK